jgi:hypothetical protein
MTREEIIAAILKVAGNPSSGVIRELAPAMADEILGKDTPATKPQGNRDTRASRAVETRETR